MENNPHSEAQPWKLKSIQMYASQEWFMYSQKDYRTVFEASETDYLYCDLRFYPLTAGKGFRKFTVDYQCFSVDDFGIEIQELGSIRKEVEAGPEDIEISVREGWGSSTRGSFWKKGRYKWVGFIEGRYAGHVDFWVNDAGSVGNGVNPYFRGAQVLLFEGPGETTPAQERKYTHTFLSGEARYIWAEIRLENIARDQNWRCELFFHFYKGPHILKGISAEGVQVKAGQESIVIRSGWGSETTGTWYPGDFSVEILFMNTLAGLAGFKVLP